MDHNLDDSLNLESAISNMDFEHSGDVVNQDDITLETSTHDNDIMEFEQIEEQPILMDTGGEEIIVPDFMGEQFTLQDYSVHDDQVEDATITIESSQLNVLDSQTEAMIDMQFKPQNITQSVSQDVSVQPKYVSIKAASSRASKKPDTAVASAPRQVAIAPKPPTLTQSQKQIWTSLQGHTNKEMKQLSFCSGTQYAIAPKPVSMVKNVSLANALGAKGTTVLAQLGKQIVTVPSGGQKIKLVPSSSGMTAVQYLRANSDQAQLIPSKNISASQGSKPVVAKVIVQGQPTTDLSNQPAVITKLVPASSATQTRYVMQQRTVPISVAGNKVLLTTGKPSVKFGKKQQVITIKSPTPKFLPATSQAATTKKVVISANTNQNVILKTTAPPKTSQANVDGNATHGQRSQLHQINVPGKGIQYIRLITNPTPVTSKPAPKPQMPALASKSFVLTDSKGNLIKMTAEKMVTSQPPPLVLTGSANAATTKVTSKPQRKLVRIAPLSAMETQQQTAQQPRPSQSLLAPLSPTEPSMEESERTSIDSPTHTNGEVDADSKTALQALINDAVGGENIEQNVAEVEVQYESYESPAEEANATHNNTVEQEDDNTMGEHPLIVIPSNYIKQQNVLMSEDNSHMLDESRNSMANMDGEMMNSFQSPRTSQTLSESELMSNELGLRPRKPCNCTKSQCLKLYCDCFANGEFCNRCNCNNCHNNLENEELRQKAIRACLDRNPNAFRPKIGKAKSGGPEVIRRHNKGCNCKRSGCLKNYCECYEAKIACTVTCKCVGCRNVEEFVERRRDLPTLHHHSHSHHQHSPRPRRNENMVFRPLPNSHHKEPCSFMTTEVIEAVCQCLIAAAVESGDGAEEGGGDTSSGGGNKTDADPINDVIEEFSRCLQDIISASLQAMPLPVLDEGQS